MGVQRAIAMLASNFPADPLGLRPASEKVSSGVMGSLQGLAEANPLGKRATRSLHPTLYLRRLLVALLKRLWALPFAAKLAQVFDEILDLVIAEDAAPRRHQRRFLIGPAAEFNGVKGLLSG